MRLLEKGDAVEMTEAARRTRERRAFYYHGIGDKRDKVSPQRAAASLFGIVARDQTDPDRVAVIRNGTTTPVMYARTWWQEVRKG